MFSGPTQPAITMGPDQLPHCAKCLAAEDALCQFHANQVDAALKGLQSQYLLARAQVDLRFITRRKSKGAEA